MHWKRGALLGLGGEALVYKAVTHQESGDTNPIPANIAVKTVKAFKLQRLDAEKNLIEQFKDCPCIITCFGSDITTEKKQKLYNVFLEYASGGSVFDQIVRHKWITEHLVRKYTKSILIALSHMHNKGYAHCDVKPNNILLFKNHHDQLAKLADFGLTRRITNNGELPRLDEYSDFEGTYRYAAPETIARHGLGPKSDIWGLGCTVLQMLKGTHTLENFIHKIGAKNEVPEIIISKNLSKEAKDFLEKCLVMNPKDRLSADALLQHPFIIDETDLSSHHHSGVRLTMPHCFHIPNIIRTVIHAS